MQTRFAIQTCISLWYEATKSIAYLSSPGFPNNSKVSNYKCVGVGRATVRVKYIVQNTCHTGNFDTEYLSRNAVLAFER